jgi:hypothetical protein
MPFVCMLLPLSVCMSVAESATARLASSALCVILYHLTRSYGLLAAALLDWWDGCVCAHVSLVRTGRKSLARVLTPSALDLSLSVSLAMHAAMPFCVHAVAPLCVHERC